MKRNIIKIDRKKCDGCGACIVSCAEGALELKGGKVRVIKESYCDGLGACVGKCPRGALRITVRDAPGFDEEAVKARIGQDASVAKRPRPGRPCCPSAQARILKPETGAGPAAGQASRLSHWPVKLELVRGGAPFLKGKELVVLADCAAVACPGLHSSILVGRAVVTGCPKFGDNDMQAERLSEIISGGGITGIRCVHMEVPCCAGLARVVADAVARSKRVPVSTCIVRIDGSIDGKAVN